jgi:hypothetical protein
MNTLIKKYQNFPFNHEFPNLYYLLLYESGGDFKCYSKILGYDDYDEFLKDYEDAWDVLFLKFIDPAIEVDKINEIKAL